jgi:peptidoglycan hydrolase-like amidase
MLESLILSAVTLLNGNTGIPFSEPFPIENLVAEAGTLDSTEKEVVFSPFDDDTFDDPETGLAPYVKQPKYISRSEWGADESLRVYSSRTKKFQKWFKTEEDLIDPRFRPEIVETKNSKGELYFWPLSRNKQVKKFVIHHTGEYVNHTRNPMEIMRAIYRFHTVNRGWGDIGYNYVIDWEGNIYEGRAGGPAIVGAHAAYHNIGTIGIALMGNFQHEEPTPRQLQVLKLLIADHAKRFNIDTNKKSYHLGTLSENVSGHGDIARKGHGTACPGKNLIKHFSEIREQSSYLTEILYRQKKADSKMARDFLSLSKDAPDVLKKGSKRFERPEKDPLIKFTNILKKPVIQRNDRKTFNIAFKNGTKDVWMPKSNIMVTNIPEGMIVTEFRLTEIVKPGDSGNFRGRIIVDKTANGNYELKLVPTFLRNKIFHGEELPILPFTVQVSGAKVPKVSANNVYKVTKKENPNYLKKLSASMFYHSAPKAEDKPNVKVKLAFFEENYADIVGNEAVEIREKNTLLGQVPSQTQIKIIPQFIKEKNQRFLEVHSQGKVWKVSEVSLRTNGILTVRNYNRNLGKINAFNSFRRQIHGYVDGADLLLVNELPIEEYLWGLAEEPTPEPEAKKHAIHVLARSYAYVYSGVRRKFKTDLYDLEDDPRSSQFYLGYDWEKYHVEQADLIKETEGEMLLYNGKPVIGPYFTQSAGQSSDKWSHAYPWTYSRPLPLDEGLEQRGHGVGLSGNSARELAKQGKDYKAIIHYFFKDISIKKEY